MVNMGKLGKVQRKTMKTIKGLDPSSTKKSGSQRECLALRRWDEELDELGSIASYLEEDQDMFSVTLACKAGIMDLA